jgi:hypothetical protein
MKKKKFRPPPLPRAFRDVQPRSSRSRSLRRSRRDGDEKRAPPLRLDQGCLLLVPARRGPPDRPAAPRRGRGGPAAVGLRRRGGGWRASVGTQGAPAAFRRRRRRGRRRRRRRGRGQGPAARGPQGPGRGGQGGERRGAAEGGEVEARGVLDDKKRTRRLICTKVEIERETFGSGSL